MPEHRIAVKAFVVAHGRLLVVRRQPKDINLPKIWELPGGRLEPGEDPFKGLMREVKEETGLSVTIGAPIEVRHFKLKKGPIITMIIFLCETDGGTVKLSAEHTAFDWITVDEAKQSSLAVFYHPSVDAYLRLFKREL